MAENRSPVSAGARSVDDSGAVTREGWALFVERERIARGWGKEEAARQAGINSITWKRVEDGERVQDASLGKVLAALETDQALAAEAIRAWATRPARDRRQREARIRDKERTGSGTPSSAATGHAASPGVTGLSIERLVDEWSRLRHEQWAIEREYADRTGIAAFRAHEELQAIFAGGRPRPASEASVDRSWGLPGAQGALPLPGTQSDLFDDPDQEDYTLAARDQDDDAEAEAQQEEP
ncbi:hypothetical protein [Isoptericola sp. NPDC056605]|uniref:hypothetical protein n=1 Tax=Isoptericola sp. NPDC056605 TaxID=3345876 RepID=UPI00368FBC29